MKPPSDAEAPNMKLDSLGEPSQVWRYTDEKGALFFYSARYNLADGKKEFRFFSWSEERQAFVMQALKENRPLYNLKELREKTATPVLLVEGEQTADAAKEILGDAYVVTTWSGGSSAHSKTDFTPLYGRKVTAWPDADRQKIKTESQAKNYGLNVGDLLPYPEQPGAKAMNIIAQKLSMFGGEVKIIDVSDVEVDGWDLADAYEEGWTRSETIAWARERVKLFEVSATRNIIADELISDEPTSSEEIQKVAVAVALLENNPGAIFDSQDVMNCLKNLYEIDRGEYFRWRQKIKGTKAFPIKELDLKIIPAGFGVEEVSPVDELIAIARDSAELFHDANDDGFADIKVESRIETWPLRSQGFKKWLRSKYYDNTERGVSEVTLSSAIDSLVAIAVNKGGEDEVYTRAARVNEKYYIDLVDKDWSVIEISAHGWKIIEKSPVKFIRSLTSRPLPYPLPKPGSLELLWNHINLQGDSQKLALAWLLESFRPETPFALLVLIGEQGSAKSSAQKILRDLLDPNKVMLRGAPKQPEDIAIAAKCNWVVSYENLSNLTPEQQDVLCVVLTGGGIAGRQLFTNHEEAAIDIKRPVILNGISTVVTRPDLLDRSIILELPKIPDENRQEQAVCDENWERDRAYVFAGLLDLFSITLKQLPTVKLDRSPRMADFARLGEAMIRAQGYAPGTFFELYTKNRRDAVDVVVDGDSVAMALVEFISKNQHGIEITTKHLFDTLKKYPISYQRDFPKSPRGLGNSLRRLAPVFRQRGWDITQEKRERGIVVVIIPCTEDAAKSQCAESAVVQPERLNGLHVKESIDLTATRSTAAQLQ